MWRSLSLDAFICGFCFSLVKRDRCIVGNYVPRTFFRGLRAYILLPFLRIIRRQVTFIASRGHLSRKNEYCALHLLLSMRIGIVPTEKLMEKRSGSSEFVLYMLSHN